MQTQLVPPSLQDILSEFSRGETGSVFIDDSGSPGGETPSPSLHPERKTWAAVIVKRHLIAEILDQGLRAVSVIRSLVPGFREFYFVEIFSGKGAFKNVDLKLRQAIFGFMSEILVRYKLPILIQTMETDSFPKSFRDNSFAKKIKGLDLSNHEDFALWNLFCVSVKRYAKEHLEREEKLRCILDEGRFEKGDVVAVCDSSGKELARGLINYPAGEMERIKGRRSGEIAELLGHRPYEEVIHRNNLAVV